MLRVILAPNSIIIRLILKVDVELQQAAHLYLWRGTNLLIYCTKQSPIFVIVVNPILLTFTLQDAVFIKVDTVFVSCYNSLQSGGGSTLVRINLKEVKIVPTFWECIAIYMQKQIEIINAHPNSSMKNQTFFQQSF